MSERSAVCKLLREERHTLTGWMRKDEQRRQKEMAEFFMKMWTDPPRIGILRDPPRKITVL